MTDFIVKHLMKGRFMSGLLVWGFISSFLTGQYKYLFGNMQIAEYQAFMTSSENYFLAIILLFGIFLGLQGILLKTESGQKLLGKILDKVGNKK